MIPFDNQVDTRLQKRDQHRPCIPTPQNPAALLPAPVSYEKNALYGEEENFVGNEVKSLNSAFKQFNPMAGISFEALGPSSFTGYEPETLATV